MKRLMAVFMVAAFTITVFSGCTKKQVAMNSSYFQELSKLSSLKRRVSSATYNYTIFSDAFAEDAEIQPYLSKGKLNVQIACDTLVESDRKWVFDLSLFLGNKKKIDTKIATIVLNEQTLYFDLSGAFGVMKTLFGKEQIMPYEQHGTIFQVDLNQLKKLLKKSDKFHSKEKISEKTLGMNLYSALWELLSEKSTETEELETLLRDMPEDQYQDLIGVSKGMYTFKVSSENVDRLANHTVNLAGNAARDFSNKGVDVVIAIFEAMGISPEGVTSVIPRYVQQAVNVWKSSRNELKVDKDDSDFNITSKIRVNEGKSAKIRIKANHINAEDGTKINMYFDEDIRADKVSIEERVPSRAFDITFFMARFFGVTDFEPDLFGEVSSLQDMFRLIFSSAKTEDSLMKIG